MKNDKMMIKQMLYKKKKCMCAICGKYMEYPDMRIYEYSGTMLAIHKHCGKRKKFLGLF